MSHVSHVEIEKTNSVCTLNEQQVKSSIESKICGKRDTLDIKSGNKSVYAANTEITGQNSILSECGKKGSNSAVPEQKSTKKYPVNPIEALYIIQFRLTKAIEDIFGPDTHMFDYLTWIAMGCGLKYVHNCNKENINQNNENQNEKVNLCINRHDKKVNESIGRQDIKLNESIGRQDIKLNESIGRQEKRLKDEVNRLEYHIDKSLANIKIDLKDRLTQISAKHNETNSQDERFHKLVAALQNRYTQNMPVISRSVSNNKNGPEDTEMLELQRQLLCQFLEAFQRWHAEDRQKYLTSNKAAHYTEQELALKAAMNRYSKRVNRNTPKYLACKYQKLQEATLQFQSYVKESKNLGEAGKSKEDIEKVLTKLQAESDGLCNKVLEVLMPTMRVMGPWVRRLKR